MPFQDATKKTKCKEFNVAYYEYNEFYDLGLIKAAQSEDYFAKLPVTFESNHGDIHVIFSESNSTTNSNRAYEFRMSNL